LGQLSRKNAVALQTRVNCGKFLTNKSELAPQLTQVIHGFDAALKLKTFRELHGMIGTPFLREGSNVFPN
jgi:hypothetical protein